MSSCISLVCENSFIINDELRFFIRDIANTSIKTEILEFIYYNPLAIYNPSYIAQALQRKEEQIKEAIGDFVEKRILKPVQHISMTLYSVNSRFYDIIDRFIKLFTSDNGREIVCSIVHENS